MIIVLSKMSGSSKMSLSLVSRYLSKSCRNYSTNNPGLVSVQINEKTGIATATLQRPPVNSLNLELLSELGNTLKELEKNKSRGLILTSSSSSVFSAGLDILEMYKPDPERSKLFWTTLQNTWMTLYGTSYPTVALINGHSPAGGCLLALSCEYRIMVNNFTIGLNETQLGIVAPFWFVSSMRNVIGHRQAELALTTGQLYKTEEACKIGLVDKVVASKDEGLQQAETFLQRFSRIPPLARTMTKRTIRGKYIEELAKNMDSDLKQFLTFVNQDKVQKGLELYLESLKQKQKQNN